MEKIKKKIKLWFKLFKNRFLNKESLLELMRYIAILGICIVSIVYLVRFLYRVILNAAVAHPVISFVVVMIIIYVVDCVMKKETTTPIPNRSQSPRWQFNKLLSDVVLQTFKRLSPILGLLEPDKVSDIQPTTNKIEEMDGIVFFNFSVAKKVKEDVDEDFAREVIEEEINNENKARRLQLNIGSEVVYNGISYPVITVHDVSQTKGRLEIVLVLTSKTYIDYLDHERLVNNDNNIDDDGWDTDF